MKFLQVSFEIVRMYLLLLKIHWFSISILYLFEVEEIKRECRVNRQQFPLL